MSPSPTLLMLIGLGGVAGVLPVYFGLVVATTMGGMIGRRWKAFLIGLSIGILFYLFADLTHEAVELTRIERVGSWTALIGSLFISFVGLVAIENRHQRRNESLPPPLFLPYMIALGLGLHNLGEGLAIGASYAQGQWVLSGLLVGGFALHNGAEGFAVVGPREWKPLSLQEIGWLGLIAGGPTCLGTMISGYLPSPYWTIAFYALGAGSLLYVIVSLATMAYTPERRLQTSAGIVGGIGLMYLTGLLLKLLVGAEG